MVSDRHWQRSDFLGTQVITRDTGKSLGVVNDLWIDVDRREVVALGLRANLLSRFLPGIQQYMLLSNIRQIGDVILVDDEDVIEDVDVEAYSRLINCEVITENGELLGRVRGFRFDVDTGKVSSLIIASLGLPLIPDQVISTYELPIDEIVSSGPDRLIVFEGAEEHLVQLTVGLLERLGLGAPPWEQEDEEYFPATTPIENQLGTGIPTRSTATTQTVQRRSTPVVEEVWEEDDWGEPAELKPIQQPQRQASKAAYYEEEIEEANWSDEPELVQPVDRQEQKAAVEAYDDLGDAWADDEEPEPYQPPKINIPKKVRAPEYEEERGY